MKHTISTTVRAQRRDGKIVKLYCSLPVDKFEEWLGKEIIVQAELVEDLLK